MHRYTPRDLAKWALLGDDTAVEPRPLRPIIDRIEAAIRNAHKWVQDERSEEEAN